MARTRSASYKTQAYIGGKWTGARDGKKFKVINPADGSLIAQVSDCGKRDAEAAINAAFDALPSWKGTLAKDRAQLLKKWAKLINDRIDDLATLLTTEQGKPLAEAKTEIVSGAAMVEWAAEEARRVYGQNIPAIRNDSRIMVTREAVGVAAAITPWNFPHSMITRKVAPALAAGCTVVLKPAEDTPLSALALAVLAEEAGFPGGVFNVLPSSRPKDVGLVLSTHPKVAKLSFTGSTEVGRILMEQAAPTLKRVSLELGGNAPFIVFDDADVDIAVEQAIFAKYRNAGQTCICANRIYVQRGVYKKFSDALIRASAGLKMGSGKEKNVQIGPLINDQAVGKVDRLVKDAVKHGAKLALGGKSKNLFYEPTVLLDATSSMALNKEEIFGPVSALFPFNTEEQVIKLANASEHGLAAYFFTKDLGRAFRVAEALEYGMVGINDTRISTEAAPFGGVKQSGFGREGGGFGIEEYTQVKYTLVGGL